MQRQSTIWSAEDELLTLFTTTVTLSPTQQKVAGHLLADATTGKVCLLKGAAGMGKTTILRWLHGRLGGVFVAARQWVAATSRRAQPSGTIVFVDDLAVNDIDQTLNAHFENRFVFSTNGNPSRSLSTHAIKNFKADDYAAICKRYLGHATSLLDMAKIHHSAPALNANQLKYACLRLGLRAAAPSTKAFLDCV